MNQILFGEILFATLISVIGASLLRIGSARLGVALTVQFSGIIGVLFISLTSVAALLFRQANNVVAFSILSLGVLVLAFLLDKRRARIKEGLLCLAYSALAGAAVTFVVGFLVAPVLTFDSWRFLEIGSSVFGDGIPIDQIMSGVLGSYPIALLSVEGLAGKLGMPFAASSLAAVSVLGLSGAFNVCAHPLSQSKRGFRVVTTVILIIGGAVSMYVTRVQLGYIGSHALAAAYYSIGVAAIFAPNAGFSLTGISSESARASLLGVACAGASLTRVEGPLTACLLLVAAITYRGWSRRSIVILMGWAFVVPAFWYGGLAILGASTDILSPIRMVAMLSALGIPLLVAAFVKPSDPIPWFATLALMTMAVAIVIMGSDSTSHLGASVSALAMNLGSKGLWGITWWVVLPLAILALARINADSSASSWTVVTFGFVLLILILGGIRDMPYRSGWGDSGNRMMVHVLPAFILLIFHAFNGREQEPLASTAIE